MKRLNSKTRNRFKEILELGSNDRLTNKRLLNIWSLVIDWDLKNFSDLSRCKNLTSLYMQSGKIKDLTHLKDLPLKFIDLFGNKITNLEPLKSIKDLHYLNISQNPVTDFLPLCCLKNLSFLYADIPFHQSFVLKGLPKLEEYNGKPIISRRYTWQNFDYMLSLIGTNISLIKARGRVDVVTVSNNCHLRTSYIRNINLKEALIVVEEMIATSGLKETKKIIETEFVTTFPPELNLCINKNLMGAEMIEMEDKDEIFRGL